MISGILTTDPSKRFKIRDIIEHDWMTTSLNSQHLKLESGFMVEKQDMVIDEQILEQLVSFNFNVEYAKACL